MKAFGTFDVGCDNCECAAFVPVLSYVIGDGSITFTDGSTLDAGDTLRGIVITVEDQDGNIAVGEITVLGGSVVIDTSDLNQLEMNIRATISTDGGCAHNFAWENAVGGAFGLSRPDNFALDPTGQTTVTADWDAVDNADGYILERAEDADFTVNEEVIYTGPLLTFDDTGLTADTEYFYRVRATNSGPYGDSAWSTDSVTTDV